MGIDPATDAARCVADDIIEKMVFGGRNESFESDDFRVRVFIKCCALLVQEDSHVALAVQKKMVEQDPWI